MQQMLWDIVRELDPDYVIKMTPYHGLFRTRYTMSNAVHQYDSFRERLTDIKITLLLILTYRKSVPRG